MLVFLVSYLEWAKLIMGCVLTIVGFLGFLDTAILWLITSRTNVQRWLMFALNIAISLIVMIAGFYIAGW